MKQAKKLKVFGLMTMLISMVFMVSSCSDDDTGGGALSYGKVTGVVTDDLSSPLEGVTVLVDGSGITATPDGPQATTNSQGVYTLENIFNRYTYNYIYESRLPDGKRYRCGRKIQRRTSSRSQP